MAKPKKPPISSQRRASSHDSQPPPGERLFDNFGDEKATADLARAHDHADEFFIHTKAIRHFLERDPGYPFIVGGKGAGKSLLLFKKMLAARSLSGALVLPRPPEKAFSPAIEFANLVDLSHFWDLWADDGTPNLAAWGSLWEWAILRAVLGAWLQHDRRAGTKGPQVAELSQLTAGIEDADPFELICEHLQLMMVGHHQKHGRPLLPAVAPLRRFAVRHGAQYPPVYLFLDNHDDFFKSGPEFWMASCYGTFLAIQSIHERSNRRIHCFLTIRPEVVWELQKSEHYPKWGADIFRIEWEDSDLIELFKKRAARLKHDLLLAPALSGKDPIGALLGNSVPGPDGRPAVRSLRSSVTQPVFEPVEQYILRHTLRRPRDMIIVGNQILAKMRQLPTPNAMNEDRLREAVNEGSRVIGQGYLAEVAQHWPWGSDGATSLKGFLTDFITANVIHRTEAIAIQKRFAEAVGRPATSVHPLTELVALGLAGIVVPGEDEGVMAQHFVMAGETTISTVPRTADWYVLHPVLCGTPFHITPVGGQIIGPGLSFDPSKVRRTSTPPPRPDKGINDPPFARPTPPRVSGEVFRWIHLSDLHFGAGNVAHRFDQKAVMRAILRDIAAHGPNAPDAIFVTGDVAFSGQAAQYEEATQWLREIAAAARIGPESIHIVPGNHDVVRSVAARPLVRSAHQSIRARPEFLDDHLDDDDSRRKLADKLAAYSAFVENLSSRHKALPGLALDWRESVSIPGTPYRVRIVGLSSVWVSDEHDGRDPTADSPTFVPNLVLGSAQLLKLLSDVAEDELLFALSHHPPEWLHKHSADALARALARPAHLHLCGHVHDAQAATAKRFGAAGRSIRYVAGAAHGDPTEAGRHGYAWGAVRWNRSAARWEAGWAPRVYVAQLDEICPLSYRLDDKGYAWEPLDLRWAPPT